MTELTPFINTIKEVSSFATTVIFLLYMHKRDKIIQELTDKIAELTEAITAMQVRCESRHPKSGV